MAKQKTCGAFTSPLEEGGIRGMFCARCGQAREAHPGQPAEVPAKAPALDFAKEAALLATYAISDLYKGNVEAGAARLADALGHLKWHVNHTNPVGRPVPGIHVNTRLGNMIVGGGWKAENIPAAPAAVVEAGEMPEVARAPVASAEDPRPAPVPDQPIGPGFGCPECGGALQFSGINRAVCRDCGTLVDNKDEE